MDTGSIFQSFQFFPTIVSSEVIPPHGDTVLTIFCQQLRKQLHAKIEVVESIYDHEHQKFSAELGKQAASLTPRIQVRRRHCELI